MKGCSVCMKRQWNEGAKGSKGRGGGGPHLPSSAKINTPSDLNCRVIPLLAPSTNDLLLLLLFIPPFLSPKPFSSYDVTLMLLYSSGLWLFVCLEL